MRIPYTGPGEAQFAKQSQVRKFATSLLAALPEQVINRKVAVMLETAEFATESMTIRECLEKMKAYPHMEYCLVAALGADEVASSVAPGRYLISVLMGWDGEKFTGEYNEK